MKTRIIYTKIWEDDFFSTLTLKQQLLFLFLLTNARIGLTGMYELTDKTIKNNTKLRAEDITLAKEVFTNARKVFFKESWVYVVNAKRLNGYHGEKLNKAVSSELSLIPLEVYQYFKSVDLSVNPDRVSVFSDTTKNHKSKIINHKSETIIPQDSKAYEILKQTAKGVKGMN